MNGEAHQQSMHQYRYHPANKRAISRGAKWSQTPERKIWLFALSAALSCAIA